MRSMRRAGLLAGLWLMGCAAATTQSVPPAQPSDSTQPIPPSWSVPASATVDPAMVCAGIHCRRPDPADVTIVATAEGVKLVRGGKDLTPSFLAIDSYDVSAERKEVVFSAKRKDNFDVGLVSIDGSPIHWIFPDPVDETMAEWAPSGNKISYVMHTPGGDMVRTVHIPTAATLTVPLRWSRVRGVAWEPEAKRISVTVSGVSSSDRVDSLRYNGEESRTEVAPSARLTLAVEPFAGGVLLRPPVMRYGERFPLVVWLGDPCGWDEARAMLLNRGGIVGVVVKAAPDAAFWTAVSEAKFIDPERVWVVGVAGDRPGVTYVMPDAAIPSGSYRLQGSVLHAPAADVQSVAAGFIADHLKGIDPRNGSHR
jgi:hypothetical protein